jgi:DNA-binding winged helix-turn-helix (wHTH) protein
VWSNTFVESANLTVLIAALRWALRDGRGDNRFLINIPGRSYRFIAWVKTFEELVVVPRRASTETVNAVRIDSLFSVTSEATAARRAAVLAGRRK